jgi:hypothetical protein
MDWQQLVSLAIVAAALAGLVASWLSKRKMPQSQQTGCGFGCGDNCIAVPDRQLNGPGSAGNAHKTTRADRCKGAR